MLPYLPQSFHEEFADAVARRSLTRDPDGFLAEIHVSRPDPVGVWFVRSVDALVERVDALKDRLAGRPRPAARPTLAHEPEVMPRC